MYSPAHFAIYFLLLLVIMTEGKKTTLGLFSNFGERPEEVGLRMAPLFFFACMRVFFLRLWGLGKLRGLSGWHISTKFGSKG